jgi:hypothetical protein
MNYDARRLIGCENSDCLAYNPFLINRLRKESREPREIFEVSSSEQIRKLFGIGNAEERVKQERKMNKKPVRV